MSVQHASAYLRIDWFPSLGFLRSMCCYCHLTLSPSGAVDIDSFSFINQLELCMRFLESFIRLLLSHSIFSVYHLIPGGRNMWLDIVVVVTKVKKSVEAALFEYRWLRGLPLSRSIISVDNPIPGGRDIWLDVVVIVTKVKKSVEVDLLECR